LHLQSRILVLEQELTEERAQQAFVSDSAILRDAVERRAREMRQLELTEHKFQTCLLGLRDEMEQEELQTRHVREEMTEELEELESCLTKMRSSLRGEQHLWSQLEVQSRAATREAQNLQVELRHELGSSATYNIAPCPSPFSRPVIHTQRTRPMRRSSSADGERSRCMTTTPRMPTLPASHRSPSPCRPLEEQRKSRAFVPWVEPEPPANIRKFMAKNQHQQRMVSGSQTARSPGTLLTPRRTLTEKDVLEGHASWLRQRRRGIHPPPM